MDTVTSKSDLLTLLRAAGYKGKDDLAEVRAFLPTSEFEIDDTELDALWAADPKAPEVKRKIEAKAAPVADTAALDALKAEVDALKRSADKADAAKRTPVVTRVAPPVSYERKAYAAKAARGLTAFPDADIAEAFGAYVRSALPQVDQRFANYPQAQRDAEIVRSFQRASSTTNNLTGGALIPQDFSPFLIELREQYGVFPRAVGTMTISRDTLVWPRNTSDQTVYWTSESTVPTESDPALDNVSITLNKLLGLSRHPSELLSDSAINVGELTARSFARESGRKIDDAGFNGTGVAAYGGFYGLAGKFASLSGTVANIAGWVTAAGSTFASVTAANFNEAAGRLPVYAMNGAKWYIHSKAAAETINRLKLAQGGATAGEMASSSQQTLFGYPIEYVQVMPSASAASTIFAYFGNLSLAAKFAVHSSGIALDRSDQRYFDQDQVAFRFRERCGILVHDVGNASATAASRVAGPVVALALSA